MTLPSPHDLVSAGDGDLEPRLHVGSQDVEQASSHGRSVGCGPGHEDDGLVRFIRVTADVTQLEDPWWTAGRAETDSPAFAGKILNGPRTFIVMPRHADLFRARASGVPGWREGLFTFEEIDLEEVMRTVGCAKAKPRDRCR